MFAEKLKALREARGVSQAKLAEAIHVSRSAVAKWENGLGLPGEDSLELLAAYFGVERGELLPESDDRENEAEGGDAEQREGTGKRGMTAKERRLVAAFAGGCGIGLLVLALIFIEPLRDSFELLGLGSVIAALGIWNMRGNIGSVHWYNRRKVSQEDQLPYCRTVGAGTLVVGAAMIAAGIIQAAFGEMAGAAVVTPGILIGLALILYAQFRYNKGIF